MRFALVVLLCFAVLHSIGPANLLDSVCGGLAGALRNSVELSGDTRSHSVGLQLLQLLLAHIQYICDFVKQHAVLEHVPTAGILGACHGQAAEAGCRRRGQHSAVQTGFVLQCKVSGLKKKWSSLGDGAVYEPL